MSSTVKLVKKIFGKKPHQRREVSKIYTKKDYPEQKEAITRLRDNVLFYCIDGNKQIITLCSSVSFEAKTTTAANLAVALTESKKKVLLIDLDLKKPNLHRIFGCENKDGLIDFLLDKITIDEAIKKTEYPGLDFLNRGMSVGDTSSFFESNKFKTLIEQCKEKYDFIILDSSPVLLTSDYIYIAKISDGVVFTYAYAQTRKQQTMDAINLLKELQAPIIGCVFTFFDNKQTGDYYDYYYNYNYKPYQER